ncbi:hypothetical protein ABVK25_010726 [Lepraria finkii]|uniref:Uncharacterized protein n=1 Tax=Lepraria finkii TaxID=1340010 RepID=A0ABR4ATD9_9LECA
MAFNNQLDNPDLLEGCNFGQGMAGQTMFGPAATQINNLSMESGINPGNLSESQLASFQQQNPVVQQKSIQINAKILQRSSANGLCQMLVEIYQIKAHLFWFQVWM